MTQAAHIMSWLHAGMITEEEIAIVEGREGKIG